MAELNVQPKKQSSILPWILLVLGVIALIWFLTRDKSTDETETDNRDTTATAAVQPVADNTRTDDWNDINFAAPGVMYDEIESKDVEVRGNDNYGIYALDEKILFDEGQATIRTNAEPVLKQVAASLSKRYDNAPLRVYGHTDAEGTASANKELAEKRAEAVKSWLQTNGVSADRISVNAVGEGQPVASNDTQQGRQANRRVEIVARKTVNAG